MKKHIRILWVLQVQLEHHCNTFAFEVYDLFLLSGGLYNLPTRTLFLQLLCFSLYPYAPPRFLHLGLWISRFLTELSLAG